MLAECCVKGLLAFFETPLSTKRERNRASGRRFDKKGQGPFSREAAATRLPRCPMRGVEDKLSNSNNRQAGLSGMAGG